MTFVWANLYVQSRTDNLEGVKECGWHGMGFGLALYIQTDTDSYFFFYRCTVHLDIIKVFHSPTDALFINPRKL
jgi:hypothetical protein